VGLHHGVGDEPMLASCGAARDFFNPVHAKFESEDPRFENAALKKSCVVRQILRDRLVKNIPCSGEGTDVI